MHTPRGVVMRYLLCSSTKHFERRGKNFYQNCSKNWEISNFGFLPVFVFSFSLTWDHMGVKVSNYICSESIHQICSPKFMYAPGEGLYQSC